MNILISMNPLREAETRNWPSEENLAHFTCFLGNCRMQITQSNMRHYQVDKIMFCTGDKVTTLKTNKTVEPKIEIQ